MEYYQKLKEDKHPAKMLAVADHWLRKELERNREKRKFEKAQGAGAHELDPTNRQGRVDMLLGEILSLARLNRRLWSEDLICRI